MSEITITLTGDKALLKLFEELPGAAQNRVLRPLVKLGVGILARAEQSEAPTQSGLLKSAIGATPVKTYRKSTLFATAGVRRGFRRAVQRSSRGKLRFLSKAKTAENPDASIQNPTKYLHIVTKGRKAVSALNAKSLYDPRTGRFFGKSVAASQPNPFISHAFDTAQQGVVSAVTEGAPDQILAEAARLGSTR